MQPTGLRWIVASVACCAVFLLAACAQVTLTSNAATSALPAATTAQPATPTDLTLEVNPYEIEESFSTRELQDEINAIQRQRDADRLSNYLDRIQNIPPARLP